MSDLIGATSLLTAIVGALYSLWYPELRLALAKDVARKRDDRNGTIRDVAAVFWTRAVPLAASSIVLSFVLLPELVGVLYGSAQGVAAAISDGSSHYETLEAVFVVAFGFLVSLAALSWSHAFGLIRLLRRLRGPNL